MKDKLPVKSLVIGRPILLALEDVDGSPSFLEKALRFIEEHGGFFFFITVCDSVIFQHVCLQNWTTFFTFYLLDIKDIFQFD